jgi:zeaxanthin glucosyltransferase
MSTVLLVTLPERGHISPLLPITRELARRGIAARFSFRHRNSAVFDALGISDPILPAGSKDRPVSANSFDRRLTEEIITETGDYIYFRKLAAWVEHARAAMTLAAPQAVLCNPMVYEGALAASTEGLPFASLSTNFTLVTPDRHDTPLRRASAALAAAREEALAPFGFTTTTRRGELLLGPKPMIQTTRELTGHEPLDVELVGPMLEELPGGSATAAPRSQSPEVLVAFGTVHRPPDDFLELLRDAMARLPKMRFTVTFKNVPGPFGESCPANVQLLPFVAQRAALTTAAAMIHHGGANSANEALWEGVPQLVYPLFSDGFDSAALLGDAGVAERIPDEVNVASLVRLIEAAVDGTELRARAAEVSRSYRHARRVHAVVDELCSLM